MLQILHRRRVRHDDIDVQLGKAEAYILFDCRQRHAWQRSVQDLDRGPGPACAVTRKPGAKEVLELPGKFASRRLVQAERLRRSDRRDANGARSRFYGHVGPPEPEVVHRPLLKLRRWAPVHAIPVPDEKLILGRKRRDDWHPEANPVFDTAGELDADREQRYQHDAFGHAQRYPAAARGSRLAVERWLVRLRGGCPGQCEHVVDPMHGQNWKYKNGDTRDPRMIARLTPNPTVSAARHALRGV
jgi:hypothetical protein